MSDLHQPAYPHQQSSSTPMNDGQPEPPSIERREELTPVSPRPIHVAEASSSIPVLRNQMDPGLNSSTSNGPFVQDEDEDESDNEDANDDGDDDTDFYEPEPSSSTDHHGPFHTQPSQSGVSNGFLSGPIFSSSENLNDNAESPPRPIMVASQSTKPQDEDPQKTSHNAPTTTEETPNTLPNIDLQALLTRLSPPTLQQQPTQDAHILKSPPSGVLPSIPTKLQTPPKPPIAQPTTHALPALVAPVVNSPHIAPRGLPAFLPNPSTFQQHRPLPSSPTGTEEYEDHPFTAEEEEAFQRFLDDEREYVSKGQWDRFPIGSRLFIGNLPSEKVTKRDLFRIFSRHGRLAQVSIKQAYGFVQFLDASACTSALRDEQGTPVRGRKMHLEISKPQGKSRQVDSAVPSRNRRSRSPDYQPVSPRTSRNNPPSSRTGNERNQNRDSRRDFRERDRDRGRGEDYDRAWYPRGRDDYRPQRRERSRSPPPMRYRSRSRSVDQEELNIPRRAPSDVPEVQIIVKDEVDRNFLYFVEKAFRDRMVRVDVLFLEPRITLDAVIRRQILEGVQAVVTISRQMQLDGRIQLQVFNRQAGNANVRFDEYDQLDPAVACELVIRARQTHGAPQTQMPYNGAVYGAPVQPQPAVAQLLTSQAANPNLANLIGSLDAATLQKLIANLQQQQQPIQQQQTTHYQQQPQVQMTPDLAALLSGHHVMQPGYNMQGNPALASLLAQTQAQAPQIQNHMQPQQQQQQQQPALSTILETLGRFKGGL